MRTPYASWIPLSALLPFLKNKIWANRLIAGTQVWDSVPDYRKNGVKTELASRVEDGEINADRYEEITGEKYVVAE